MSDNKIRINFSGLKANAENTLSNLDKLAREHPDFDADEFNVFDIVFCLSAYHDTLLALCTGKVSMETVLDFWFHGTDPKTIPCDGRSIYF